MTSYDSMNSMCSGWEELLIEEREYGSVKNVGIAAAFESFFSQLRLTVYNLCSDSTSPTAFARKCDKYIEQSGVFPLLEDD